MFDSGYAAVAEEPRPSVVPLWSSWVPGPELAAALAGSEAVDLVDDEGHDAAERLAGWEAIANWATGHLYRETGEYLHARQGRVRGAGQAELVSEAVAMEVATLARVAPRTGEIRICQAETLIDQLPRTLDALEAGQISMSHVRVVIEQTELCDPGTARAVDAELWSRPARDRTPTQLRDLVRRIVTRLDPDQLRRRPEQARKDRDLRYWSDDHGAIGVLQLRLPADEARGVYAVIDGFARRAGDGPDGEKRTLAQKRADTTRDLVLDGATARQGDCAGDCSCGAEGAGGGGVGGDLSNEAAGEATDTAPAEPTDEAADAAPAGPTDVATDEPSPTASCDGDPVASPPNANANADPRTSPSEYQRDPVRGVRVGARTPVRAEVRVTIGWDVLAGFSDRPAELEGHGPIPAEMGRRLAGDPDSWWRRLLTDPVTGTASHLDARRYRPPGSMQEFVRARDMTCAAPGCRVPAARCDLDHVVPYEHGRPGGGAGPTRADRLKPECRRHHRLKTLSDWTAELGPDPEGGGEAVIIWTSPSGHRWWVRPPELDPPSWERPTDDWPRDVDSWRRREADPRAVGSWPRAG
ncbi:DUF222 domain-containing protein [Actinomycetospora callitridis]|uniref:DUF222 domain-containing protein n=1 Tax=Actinomycetospora callitridis TaxID=913944 RepID=UPI0023671CC1|nr:DUF222 domain-containing protein [Actinomycetospora callitridis]MDD7916234.1 DUF222 domain-containing protein [Actinomycetospora callitridis]